MIHLSKTPHRPSDIRVHSMLIDGKRWDCLNGFTNKVSAMAMANL